MSQNYLASVIYGALTLLLLASYADNVVPVIAAAALAWLATYVGAIHDHTGDKSAETVSVWLTLLAVLVAIYALILVVLQG